MARKKKETDQTQDEVQDQPERDIFDEDDEGDTPPKLDPDHPDAQDAPEKPQDAQGDAPTQQKDQSIQDDPERVPGDPETAANERVLDTKGDLQPVVDQSKTDPFVFQGTQAQAQPGQLIDPNDPEYREKLKRELLAEMQREATVTPARQTVKVQGITGQAQGQGVGAFKVTRGMVGAFPEGSVVPDMKTLGVNASQIQRLLDAGVIAPFQAEEKS